MIRWSAAFRNFQSNGEAEDVISKRHNTDAHRAVACRWPWKITARSSSDLVSGLPTAGHLLCRDGLQHCTNGCVENLHVSGLDVDKPYALA